MSKFNERPKQVEAWQVPPLTVTEKPSPKTKVKIGDKDFPAGIDSGGPFIVVGGKAARPGSWVVTHENGQVEVMADKDFQHAYVTTEQNH